MDDVQTQRQAAIALVRDILADVLDNDALQIDESTVADEVPDWDSINHVRLLLGVEREYGVRFTPQEVGDLGTVGDLVDLILKAKSR